MTAETLTASGARVWVGCLGCYNAGALVGAWVDALEAEQLEPHEHLASAGIRSPACGRLEGADERWCLDLEGFGGFASGEMSPSEAQRIAEQMAAIEADGQDLGAVAAWLDWESEPVPEDWSNVSERFADEYAGHADSGPDYAEELAEELGAFVVDAGEYGTNPVDVSGQWPFGCIDWSRAWRELELGDGYAEVEDPAGGVFVFRPS